MYVWLIHEQLKIPSNALSSGGGGAGVPCMLMGLVDLSLYASLNLHSASLHNSDGEDVILGR